MPGGGGLLSPKSYVNVPAGPQKSDFLYTNVVPNFPPINIPFLKEKHPILTKLGAFYNNLPKIHPIYVIWTPSSLMEKSPIAIPNFAKKSPPKGRHIYVYHVNVRTPPPSSWQNSTQCKWQKKTKGLHFWISDGIEVSNGIHVALPCCTNCKSETQWQLCVQIWGANWANPEKRRKGLGTTFLRQQSAILVIMFSPTGQIYIFNTITL